MSLGKLRIYALICLIFTLLWIIFMITSLAGTDPVNTLDQAVASVANSGVIFKLTYINAVFVTITATGFYACLYKYCKPINEGWSLTGFTFIPVYCAMNLFVYFSQISVIPRLTDLASGQDKEIYRVILGQFIQGWQGSAISVLNQLAYAVLGIPSIIFAVLSVKAKKLSLLSGSLLALNGAACIIGAAGTAAGIAVLAGGSMLGGILFLFALLTIVLESKLIKRSNEKNMTC